MSEEEQRKETQPRLDGLGLCEVAKALTNHLGRYLRGRIAPLRAGEKGAPDAPQSLCRIVTERSQVSAASHASWVLGPPSYRRKRTCSAVANECNVLILTVEDGILEGGQEVDNRTPAARRTSSGRTEARIWSETLSEAFVASVQPAATPRLTLCLMFLFQARGIERSS